MIGSPDNIIVWLTQQPDDKVFEVKEYRKKRSLNANSYAWGLCSSIANILGSTKEEVYKKVIREVGEFEVIPIRKDAVEKFIKIWRSKGLGWLCDAKPSKLEGFVNVTVYYGSSVYDTQQMSRLINSLVEEAKVLGIVTLDELKIKELIDRYDKGEIE